MFEIEIHKFGGVLTSTSQNFMRIKNVIESRKTKVVVVISATRGFTDFLQTNISDNNDISAILEHTRAVHAKLLDVENIGFIAPEIDQLGKLLLGVNYVGELSESMYATLLSYGERINAKILKSYLGESCKIVYPEEFLITNGNYPSAKILLDVSEYKAKCLFENHFKTSDILIVPGFYGISTTGKITLLGRSGTDYTATALAHMLDSKITIWKNVDGFMTADPEIDSHASYIEQLSYAEAEELAYFGANVLHPSSLLPLKKKTIPLLIKNFNAPDRYTTISDNGSVLSGKIIKSIASQNNLAIVRLYVVDGGNTDGIIASLTAKLSEMNINIFSITTSHSYISLAIEENKIQSLISSIEGLDFIDNISVEREIGLICIAGEGLGKTPGIIAGVFSAIAEIGVNLEMHAGGASMTASHFAVKSIDLNRTIEAIHEKIFGLEVLI